jgi:hypothetical protein
MTHCYLRALATTGCSGGTLTLVVSRCHFELRLALSAAPSATVIFIPVLLKEFLPNQVPLVMHVLFPIFICLFCRLSLKTKPFVPSFFSVSDPRLTVVSFCLESALSCCEHSRRLFAAGMPQSMHQMHVYSLMNLLLMRGSSGMRLPCQITGLD